MISYRIYDMIEWYKKIWKRVDLDEIRCMWENGRMIKMNSFRNQGIWFLRSIPLGIERYKRDKDKEWWIMVEDCCYVCIRVVIFVWLWLLRWIFIDGVFNWMIMIWEFKMEYEWWWINKVNDICWLCSLVILFCEI